MEGAVRYGLKADEIIKPIDGAAVGAGAIDVHEGSPEVGILGDEWKECDQGVGDAAVRMLRRADELVELRPCELAPVRVLLLRALHLPDNLPECAACFREGIVRQMANGEVGGREHFAELDLKCSALGAGERTHRGSGPWLVRTACDGQDDLVWRGGRGSRGGGVRGGGGGSDGSRGAV